MGTTLNAMKRAARAVLRDELRAMRKERAARQERGAVVLAEVQRMLAERSAAATAYSNEAGKLRAELAGMRERTEKVLRWARRNRSGDFTVQACGEFILHPAKPVYGAGCLAVNPFDRWQVLPILT